MKSKYGLSNPIYCFFIIIFVKYFPFMGFKVQRYRVTINNNKWISNHKSGHTTDRKCHHLFSINFLSGCAVYQQAKEQLKADFVFPSRKNIYPIYPISRWNTHKHIKPGILKINARRIILCKPTYHVYVYISL